VIQTPTKIPTSTTHAGRIAAIDGLRAVAVLGVIWAHVWMHSGNPSLSMGHLRGVSLDLNRLISIVGSGVDLFFVISGFCMFWMYARKSLHFNKQSYLLLLKSRWLRIAPAFYAASAVCAVGWWAVSGQFPWQALAGHFVFLNGILPGSYNLAAPFWSLATEWQFYLVLPLICFLAFRLGFWRGSFLAIGACVGFRVLIWLGHPEWSVVFEGQLPFRLVEFVWGMMAAYLFSRGTIPPACLRGLRGFLLGLAVAYTGRFLRVTEIVQSTASLGPLCKALAEPVMSLGFALILWNSISSDSIISQGLCHKSMTAIGRWSYSLYLWHWYPSIWISHFVIRRYGSSTATQYLAFALTLAVVVPISWLSYKWLEAFYFRKKHHT
jgi:peptidoglycan/LPS O-acetylase OafA/YrhL